MPTINADSSLVLHTTANTIPAKLSMVPGKVYLTKLPGNRAGLVRKKKHESRPSSWGIIGIAQAIGPSIFNDKSAKGLHHHSKSASKKERHHPPQPPLQLDHPAPADTVTAERREGISEEAQTLSPNAAPVTTPASPAVATDSVAKPTCSSCGRYRSHRYQLRHPVAPGKVPKVGVCRKCVQKKTATEVSDSDHHRSRRKHRSRHPHPTETTKWSSYFGIRKVMHGRDHLIGRRPSPEPVRIVCRTTYRLRSTQSERRSRVSNGKNAIKEGLEELNINDGEEDRHRTPSADRALGEKKEMEHGHDLDDKISGENSVTCSTESLHVESGTPKYWCHHEYFPRHPAPYAKSGRDNFARNAPSGREHSFVHEGPTQLRYRSVRTLRVSDRLDESCSHHPPMQRIRVGSKSDQSVLPSRSARGVPRPPTRSVRVVRVSEDPEELPSNPRPMRMIRASPEFDESPPHSQSGRGASPPPSRSTQRVMQPLARSLRVVRVSHGPHGSSIHPRAAELTRPASESDGSPPPIRSARVVRASDVFLDKSRSHSQSVEVSRAADHGREELRPRSRSVRFHQRSTDAREFSSYRSRSTSPEPSRAPRHRSPSPARASDNEKAPRRRRRRARYQESESGDDSGSLLADQRYSRPRYPSTPHPFRIIRIRHDPAYNGQEDYHSSDRHSAHVDNPRASSHARSRHFSPAGKNSRSLSPSYQPAYEDDATAAGREYDDATYGGREYANGEELYKR